MPYSPIARIGIRLRIPIRSIVPSRTFDEKNCTVLSSYLKTVPELIYIELIYMKKKSEVIKNAKKCEKKIKQRSLSYNAPRNQPSADI